MSGTDDHRSITDHVLTDVTAYFYGGDFDGCPINVDHHCPHFNGPTTHVVTGVHLDRSSFAFHVD